MFWKINKNDGSKFLFSLKPGLPWVEALCSKKKVCYRPVPPRHPQQVWQQALQSSRLPVQCPWIPSVTICSQPDSERCTKNTEILAKKLALRLWVCTVIRACFICNQRPNPILQSLEILQNRNKHDVIGVRFIACFLLQNKVCIAWSGLMWPAHYNV